MAQVEINVVYRDRSGPDRRRTADGLRGIGDAAQRAAPKLNAFERAAVGAMERVGHTAVDLLGSAVAALGGFVMDSLDAAGDYEQAMNVFQTQSGATADQMDAVKRRAQELGADLTLPATSAASAGEAMLELSKAGLSVQQSMDAAKGTLQLAAAAQIDEASAAAISANALNTFNLEAERATYVADLLAATANASSASMTDLAQGFQQGGFAFAAAGQEIDDLAASLAILTNVGLTGSDAGTALKNALMRLMNPTDQASDLMASLGINVYDAQGNMLPMRDIIDELNTGFEGMTQKERNAALATIFLSDGMKAMIPLLDAGVIGYEEMVTAVNQSGAAADLAKAQMMGLHGAVGGLSSQVETLMLEALEPLLPLITSVISRSAEWVGSFQGQVGPAVVSVIDFTSSVISVIETGLIPALGAAGIAAVTWAAINSGALLTSLITMLPQLAAATAAWLANAVAVAAAAAPYIAVGVAIARVAVAWTEFQESYANATTQLLESRSWWEDSARALESYGAAAEETQTALQPYAATIEAIREQIRNEIEDLSKRRAAGLVTDEQFRAEMETINQHTLALQTATTAYNEQEQALIRTQTASMTATEQLNNVTAGEAALAVQTQLTFEELEELQKQLQDTFETGAEAVGAFVETEIGFLEDLQQAHIDGNAQITTDQALTYARQQGAQQAHLGQMLADYTTAQVAMGNITATTGEEILREIDETFGGVENSSSRTFMALARHIDEAAANGGTSLSNLDDALAATAQEAVNLEERARALERQYTMELVENFNSGKINVEQFRQELARIPSKVRSSVEVDTKVHVRVRYSGERGIDTDIDGRQHGGPVEQGTPYLVGERGPELFVPRQDGVVLPNQVTNNVLNYYGSAGVAPQEDVAMALRMRAMLYG